MNNQAVVSSMLKVPGATIYYEIRGSGPLVVLIPGGPQDAGVFDGIAEQLSDRYTVLAYDPRGNSRSIFDGEPVEQDLDVHGDDAARLIEALDAGPADVFGTSGGGQIGLNLAARYPGLVRTLVAHEPACAVMLDDPSEVLDRDRAVYDVYLEHGPFAAIQKFLGDNGLAEAEEPQLQPSPAEAATFQRISGNFEYFVAHGLLPLSTYRPDVPALVANQSRISVALGEESVGQPIYGIGKALATKLGIDPISVPGDHMGFGPHAIAFAARLHQAFESSAPRFGEHPSPDVNE